MNWLQLYEVCRIVWMLKAQHLSQCPFGGALEDRFYEAPLGAYEENYVTLETTATEGWCVEQCEGKALRFTPTPRRRPNVQRCNHRCR
jgi:hypothetical protein